MTLNTHSLDQLWSIIAKHQKQLNNIIVVLLAVYLLAYLAELTWRIIPAPELQDNGNQSTATISSNSVKPKADISAIQKLHLFGEAGKKPKVAPVVTQDAPETTLSLTLTGLVASTTSDNGAAIIEYRNNQNTYGVGDVIDGTRAVISEVLRDRVILNNSGRMETLMLDGVDFTKPTTLEIRDYSDVSSKTDGQEMTKYDDDEDYESASKEIQLDQDEIETAAELRAQPERFTDFISIQPERKDGQINGYRVNPGRIPELFNAAGLEPNDVLKEINGLDLTDIKQSMQAMQMLKSEQYLDLTVDRNGEIITLTLELPEP
ncbi:MAG: type II secretion system protein GspC [Aestuariibacter sp.]